MSISLWLWQRKLRLPNPQCFDCVNYKLRPLIFNWDQILVMSNLRATVLWVGNLNCNFFGDKNLFDFNVRPRKLLKSERLRVSKQKLLVQFLWSFLVAQFFVQSILKLRRIYCVTFSSKNKPFSDRTYISSFFMNAYTSLIFF